MTSSGSQADVSRVSGSRSLRFSPQVVLVHLQQALWGVAVTMCVCCSWCGANQLAKVTLRRLNAPLTITWFSTSWNCLLFPLYYLGHLCCSAERQSPRQRFRYRVFLSGVCHSSGILLGHTLNRKIKDI